MGIGTIETQATLQSMPEQPKDNRSDKIRLAERIKSYCADCIAVGQDYRDKFSPDWEEIERQVRQIPPTEWENKLYWQTKVFVGLQAKTSESAFSNMRAMLFPAEKFFQISGVKERDRNIEENLETVYLNLLDRGGFYYQKDYLLEEAIDIGTSFVKLIARKDKSGIDFVWRSAYDILLDPHARHDFDQMKFIIDQYPRDVSYLMEELQNPGSIYDKELLTEGVEKYLAEAAGKASTVSNQEENIDIVTIRNIDGTGYLKVPKDLKSVTLNEFWGLVPIPNDINDDTKGYTLKPMVVTMINEDYVIRFDDNPYSFFPFVPARIKPRKYDLYGKGYLLNGRGTQELMNSMINLGFDSQKITSMDIIVADESKIADQSSIKYEPLAVWKVKGTPTDAIMMTRQAGGGSAINDIMQGIAYLDQVHQDVTGVTRHAEGTTGAMGEGSQDQTLGEYQLKLQAVDKRFLSVAQRFEQDFTERILRNMFSIIVNPALFSQETVNEILGVNPVLVPDPLTGQPVQIGVQPKLNIMEIGARGEMAWNFKGYGVTQFSERMAVMQKLQVALQAALQNPTLTQLTNIDVLWKRLFQVSQIPDWQEIIKSPEEVQAIQQQIMQQQMVMMQRAQRPERGGGE